MCIPTLRKSKKIHEDKFHTVQVTVASPLSSPYPSTAAGGVKMETFQKLLFRKTISIFLSVRELRKQGRQSPTVPPITEEGM